MSIEHMALVWRADGLKGPEKLLLLALANYADANGYCWPSERRLADDCGTSVRTVARVKRDLIDRNLLRTVRRLHPQTREPISNMSRINVALLRSMARPGTDYDDDLIKDLAFADTAAPAPETDPAPPTCQSGRGSMSDWQVPPVNLAGTPCQIGSQSIIEPSENHQENSPSPAEPNRLARGTAPRKRASKSTVAETLFDDAPAPAEPARSLDDDFAEWYAAYPKKVGRDGARRAYAAAVKRGATPEALLAAVREHAANWKRQGTDKRFIPYPSTWLNQGRYEDELDAGAGSSGSSGGGYRPWQAPDDEAYHAGW